MLCFICNDKELNLFPQKVPITGILYTWFKLTYTFRVQCYLQHVPMKQCMNDVGKILWCVK